MTLEHMRLTFKGSFQLNNVTKKVNQVNKGEIERESFKEERIRIFLTLEHSRLDEVYFKHQI